MRVSKNDTVCGLAAPAARQLMRTYFTDCPVNVASEILGVSQDAARDHLRAFEAAGYVEPARMAHARGDDRWVTTVKGNALANASSGADEGYQVGCVHRALAGLGGVATVRRFVTDARQELWGVINPLG